MKREGRNEIEATVLLPSSFSFDNSSTSKEERRTREEKKKKKNPSPLRVVRSLPFSLSLSFSGLEIFQVFLINLVEIRNRLKRKATATSSSERT